MTAGEVDFGNRPPKPEPWEAGPPSDDVPDVPPEPNGSPYSRYVETEPVVITWADEIARFESSVPLWICEGLGMAPGRPSAIAGEGDTRKGWFIQAMHICGAAGLPFLGFTLKENLRSVYFDWEQTKRVTFGRYQELALGYGVDLGKLGKRLGYRWKPVPSLAPRTDTERIDVISRMCRLTEGLDLAEIDSVHKCSPGVDENSALASMPLEVCTEVSERTGCVFRFIDHAGKPPAVSQPSERKRKHTQRGHSSKIDSSQALSIFSATKGQPTLVTAERCQILAQEAWHKDFRFTVGRADNGGLLLALIAGPDVAAKDPERDFDDLKAAVLKAIKRAIVKNNVGPGVGEITTLLKARRTDVAGAVEALIRERLVEDRGPRNEEGMRKNGTASILHPLHPLDPPKV